MLRCSATRTLLIAPIVCASLAVPADASIMTYSDPAVWAALVMPGFSTVNFEGLASAGVPGNFSDSSGLTLSGIQFIGLTPPGSYYLLVQDAATATKYAWGSGDTLEGPNSAWQPANPGYIQANLPAGTTAFAAYVMTHNASAKTPGSVTVSIPATGDTAPISTSASARTFIGVVSDAPILSARFQPTSASTYLLLDDFSAGQAAEPTPESETLFLGGSGLLGLWIARCLRRWAT